MAISRFLDFLEEKGVARRKELDERGLGILEDFERWMQVEGWRPHTIKVKLWHAKKWLSWCSEHGTDFLQAREEDARNFVLDLMRKGLEKRTIEHYIGNLASFYEFLRWRLKVSMNPFERVPRPKGGRRLPKSLTMEQVDRLFEVTRRMGLKYYLTVRLLYSTGMRASELLQLRWEDVDLRRRQLMIRGGKGGKDRVAYFDDKTAMLLGRWKSLTWGSKGDLVLGIRKYETLRKWFIEISENVGFYVRPHMLRHSLATHLAELGFTAPEIQRILGHERLETTSVYISLGGEHLRRRYKEFWRLREKRKS